MHVGGDVDGAALQGSFLDVAIGAEAPPEASNPQGPRFRRERFRRRFLRRRSWSGVRTIGGGPHGDHVQHAADGAGTVEVAGAAAHEFGTLDGELRLLLPMNPSADGVVEGHIVLGDEGAAGRSGAEAAYADSLRGGIGNERTGAAEHFNAGQLAHLVVQGDGGHGAERGLR
jgi:hypothetical protein